MPSWFAIVVRSFADRLVLAQLEHLDLGRDLVAGADRRAEAPVDVEEDAARPGQVLGDDGVQQPGRHAALHDDAAEAERAAGVLVVVQRVAVAGQLGEQLDVARRRSAALRRAVSPTFIAAAATCAGP